MNITKAFVFSLLIFSRFAFADQSIIQAGAFSKIDNAEAIESKLGNLGFPVRLFQEKSSQRQKLNYLPIGSYPHRQSSLNALKALNYKGVDGIIPDHTQSQNPFLMDSRVGVKLAELDNEQELDAEDEPLFEDEGEETDALDVDQDDFSLETPDDEETLDASEDEDLLLEDDADFELSRGIESEPQQEKRGIDFSGKALLDYKYFSENGNNRGQEYHHNVAFALEPEWSYQWENGNQSLVFIPYFMFDQHDSARTHFDIRELLWTKRAGDWDFRVGIGKVFWGVIESVHLADIINQTDLVVNIDTEDKLGQPMVNVAYTNWLGTFEAFVLPGFRIRTFAGREGRPRARVVVAQHDPIYESGARSGHVDFAARWSNAIGDWDIGIAHFHGTARDPRFVPVITNPILPPVKVRPLYEIIDQTSIDVQAVKGSWLWKLEAFTRSGQGSRFEAVAAGFEYTFSGAFESGADLGLLMEYLHDNRADEELTTAFDNDVFVGFRLALNDVQSTELLAGVVRDVESSTIFYNVEASRRLGEKWKLNMELRAFSHVENDDLLFGARDDDYVMLELERYF